MNSNQNRMFNSFNVTFEVLFPGSNSIMSLLFLLVDDGEEDDVVVQFNVLVSTEPLG